MYRFQYHRAKSLKQAAELFAEADDGLFLAGGQTLIPTLKQRLAAPSDVIDLSGLKELTGIEAGKDAVTVGAFTNHADVAASPDVQKTIPALAKLAGMIGDPQVRNMGTLGGSIANNDPAADYPAALLGLGATVVTDKREIAADDFFTDLFETALEEGEIIKAVRFPAPARAAYAKFPNPVSRYALAGVFIADFGDAVRVAVTGIKSCVFRLPEMEKALAKDFSVASVAKIKISEDDVNDDIHASAHYRAHLTGVMAARAVAEITGETK